MAELVRRAFFSMSFVLVAAKLIIKTLKSSVCNLNPNFYAIGVWACSMLIDFACVWMCVFVCTVFVLSFTL